MAAAGLRAVLRRRVEGFFLCVAAGRVCVLPFWLVERSVVWRTSPINSSGSSAARVFASSMTSFAWREKESLLTIA